MTMQSVDDGVRSGDLTEFGGALQRALEPIFEGRPLFVSDAPQLLEWLSGHGLRTADIDEVESRGEEAARVVLMATTTDRLPRYAGWRSRFEQSRVLIMPFIAFDPSLEAAKYTLELLAKAPVTEAVERNQQWLEFLATHAGPIRLQGGGTDLTCELDDDVTVLRPKVEVELEVGEWEGIGAYFEVGMVPAPEDFRQGIRPGYTVDGVLEVAGVAVSHHRHVGEETRQRCEEAWRLLQEVREQGGFPLRVEIEHSRVNHVWAGGDDLAAVFGELSNPALDRVLCEMAFSTNTAMDPAIIDWSYNSQLNEGSAGIHVAVGEGLSGAHIDLIAPGVDCPDRVARSSS